MANIAPEFFEAIGLLTEYANFAYFGTAGTAPREWYTPSDSSVFDQNATATAFSRNNVDVDYLQALLSGSAGEAAAMTLQCDYLACQERAWRLRNATPCRRAAHAAARHLGHGADAGIFNRVTAFAQDLIAAGGSPP